MNYLFQLTKYFVSFAQFVLALLPSKMKINKGENGTLSIQGFVSSDKINNNDPLKEDFRWSNTLFGFNWFQAADSPLFYEIGLSLSRFEGEVIPNLSKSKRKVNQLDDMTVKMDFTYMFDNKNEVEFGLKIMQLETKLFLENAFGAVSDIGSSGTNISVYSKYKFLQFDNIGVDLGTRLNLTALSKGGNKQLLEPRISMTYRIIPELALKAAWGIYVQELSTLSDETEIISLFEPWIITPSYLDPARAVHYTYGIEWDIFEGVSLDLQGYYKFVRNLPTVNENKFFGTDPDLIPGSLESSGGEALLRYNGEWLGVTASYTYSRAYKEVDGWVYYPRYDSRQSANLTLETRLGSGWSASIVWVYRSALPFTQSRGYYDKYYFRDLYTGQSIFEHYNPYAILDDINLGRLPDYHRLDITFSYKFSLSDFNVLLDLSVLNVYDRQNLFYFKRDTGERVNMLPLLPSATVKVEL